MEFVWLAPGSFEMGTPSSQPRQADEVPHRVTFRHGVYMGRFEVTQGQWQRVMGRNPSHFTSCGPNCPVEMVSFNDVQEFLRRLAEQTPRHDLRLPTEAEWEYACRAGTETSFSTGGQLTSAHANYDGRYPLAGTPAGVYLGHPTPVGSYAPNAWGLHDLEGNVWEWIDDWYGDYPNHSVVDPPPTPRAQAHRVWDARGGDFGFKKVIRGGSWYFNEDSCRCALRYTHFPGDIGPSVGFRLVRDAS
jgi:formylglycine-generating enzyme required for sulfatase activity